MTRNTPHSSSTAVGPSLEWFTSAGLGLFIHWDQASQQGIEIGWPLVDRSIIDGHAPGSEDKVSIAKYQSTATSFNPTEWSATAVARMARAAGVRYVVFTARHHAGYSMFHTDASDFSIEHSPYKEDITRQVVEAFRAEGIRVGLYYSLSDWNHPDYPRFEESDKPYPRKKDGPYDPAAFRRPSPEAWERYLDYVRSQLTELLSNYGSIDLLWFDGEWERTPEEWRADELREMIRQLQSHTIVNDRLPGQGDYVTPEQALPSSPPKGPWEMCMTMKDSWGYRTNDTSYKSPRQLVRALIEVTSRGGNLLLNIAPDGIGRIPPQEVYRLKQIGSWVSTHGESVLGVKPAPGTVQFDGPVTQRDGTLYLHLLMQPVDLVVARGLPVRRVRSVRLLGAESSLDFSYMIEVHTESKRGEDALGELRIEAPGPTGALVDVIAVELDSSS